MMKQVTIPVLLTIQVSAEDPLEAECLAEAAVGRSSRIRLPGGEVATLRPVVALVEDVDDRCEREEEGGGS